VEQVLPSWTRNCVEKAPPCSVGVWRPSSTFAKLHWALTDALPRSLVGGGCGRTGPQVDRVDGTSCGWSGAAQARPLPEAIAPAAMTVIAGAVGSEDQRNDRRKCRCELGCRR
jgi:hypothetical protein